MRTRIPAGPRLNLATPFTVTVERSDAGVMLILPVPPSANRWWRLGKGHMHKSEEARLYQAAVSVALSRQGGPIRAPRPVSVSIQWYRERKAGDLDKRLGVLLDALQGIVYENDAQVTRIVAERHEADAEGPRVVVWITERSREVV